MSGLELSGHLPFVNTISHNEIESIKNGDVESKVSKALDYLSDLIFRTDRVAAKEALTTLYSSDSSMTEKEEAFSSLKSLCRVPDAFSGTSFERDSGEIRALQVEIGFGEYLGWVKSESEDNYQSIGIAHSALNDDTRALAFLSFGNGPLTSDCNLTVTPIEI
ncbi:hypothetical protein [uncultured Shewanella sp.]|uniref:hypothetical protein n=1 Tax=uncultured Shewanella sp. TaxID=173975 RepID=UPI002611E46C|nr:hypothetical protein [uncultured Shewanella sp.]